MRWSDNSVMQQSPARQDVSDQEAGKLQPSDADAAPGRANRSNTPMTQSENGSHKPTQLSTTASKATARTPSCHMSVERLIASPVAHRNASHHRAGQFP